MIVSPDTLWLVGPGAAGVVYVKLNTPASDTKVYQLSIEDLPSGLTATLSPTSIPGVGSSALHVRIATSYSGTNTLQVCAKAPGVTGRAELVVTTSRPFTMSTPAQGVSVQAATFRVIPVNLARAVGFTGPVRVEAATSAPGVSVLTTFDEAFGVTSGTVQLTGFADVVPGQYSLVVRGKYLNFIDSLIVPFTVPAPPSSADFGLSLPPNAVTVMRGTAIDVTLDITRTATQLGAIQLVVENAPPGVNVAVPASATPGSITVTVTATAAAAAGTYSCDIVGTWQNITHRASMTVKVVDPDFQLSASPATLTAPRGGTTSLTLNINRLSPLIQAVLLSQQNEPAGVNVSFNANPESGSASGVMVDVTAAAVAGTYTFQLTGTALGITRTVDVTLTITEPSLTLSLQPSSLTLDIGGTPLSTQLSMVRHSLPQVAFVTVRPLPTGVTLTTRMPILTSGNNVTLSFVASTSAQPGTYTAFVRVSAGPVIDSVPLTLIVQAPPQSLRLSLSPSSLTLLPGSGIPVSTQLSIVRQNLQPGFAFVTIPTLPNGITQTNVLAPTLGSSVTLTFVAGSALPGTYVVMVQVVAGGINTSIALTIIVPGQPPSLGLSLSPTSLTLVPGGAAAQTTLAITRQGLLLPHVTVAVLALPNGVAPPTITPSNPVTGNSVTLSFTAAAGAQPGTYTAIVQASAVGVIQSAFLTIIIQAPPQPGGDFQLVAPAGTTTIRVGGPQTNHPLTIVRQNFAGVPITLSASGLPAGQSLVTVTPSPATGNAATITLYAAPNAPPGNYTLTITGTGNGLTRTATMAITVVP